MFWQGFSFSVAYKALETHIVLFKEKASQKNNIPTTKYWDIAEKKGM